ncbi:thioesterase family protein [uncultured Pseudoteredinibacter sp.]|uniref:acyl-CoA thioesterase n=1 Tax=uncultured Pseudoteredinibacter sp. TaxID=1641701 RepID=UPI002608A43F|nr:thioesterase family protein [uncultured Pseudoteredinibacter sp.]
MLESSIQVNQNDMNLAGHVDNVNLYRWFNDQRLELFDIISSRVGQPFVPPYVKTELQFMREVFDHEAVLLRLNICHIGGKSFRIEQQLMQDQTLCAICETTAVNFSVESQSACVIEGSIKAALEAFSRK